MCTAYQMKRFRFSWVFAVALLHGCSAVGQWIYDDPSFALRAVALHPQDSTMQGGRDSLELVLVGCNRNDFELTGDAFNTKLDLNGRRVGEGERDRPIHLPLRDTSQFSVMLAIMPEGMNPGGDRVPFAINGSSDVQTPIGVRRVDFKLHGRLQRKGDAWQWFEEGMVACRPGLAAMPPEFVAPRRPPIRPDDPDRGRPSRLPGGSQGPGERP